MRQPDRRDGRRPHPAPRFRFLECRADAAVLLGRQESLAGLFAVVPDPLAGIAAAGHQLPGLGEREHLREHRNDVVGHRPRVAHAVVEFDDVARPHVLHRHVAERGDDVEVDGGAVEALRLRLAVDLHVGAHRARREVGDGGIGFRLRRERVEAALDAVDGLGRLAAALVDGLSGDGAEGDALEAGGSARLDHIDLAAVALDADTEPGKVSVPVNRVLAGGQQGGDAAGGEAEGASLRHGGPRGRKAFVQGVAMMRTTMPTAHSAGLRQPSLCAIVPSITA